MKKNGKPVAASPANGGPVKTARGDPAAAQRAQVQALAAARPFNTGKAHEFGRENAVVSRRSASSPAASPAASASTLSEVNAAFKTSNGAPIPGRNASDGSLDRIRSDAAE